MWTPKRLLLLLLGFVFFLSCYFVYDFFLGHYDGLPPLPVEFHPSEGGLAERPQFDPRPGPSTVVAQLEKAFGPNCEEKDRRIKMEWRSQNLVLAAETWKLMDGRLHLEKVSVAFFSKPRSAERPGVEEINTVRGAHAEVEFERPLNSLRDAQQAKPVAGRIDGNVILHHNRRTSQPEDDVRLFTKWLAYREADHRIWTDADIRLLEHTPPQTTITAEGMDVLLVPDVTKTARSSQNPRQQKTPQSSVKEVRLRSKVNMNLLVDAGSSFMSGGTPRQGAGNRIHPKSPLVVTCQGPFIFHADREQAEFSDRVCVLRRQPSTQDNPSASARYDQLDCERLLLTFARDKAKGQTPGLKGHSGSTDRDQLDAGGMTILSAHAMGRPLELHSDVEGATKAMHVRAVELLYDKANEKTTLVGGKEGLIGSLQGHQLRLFGTLVLLHATGQTKDIREARAIGPGEILMADRDTPARAGVKQSPAAARWQEEMRWTKETQPDALPLDRIVFTGKATFEDPDRGRLSGSQIAIWLELGQGDKTARSVKASTPSPGLPEKTKLKRLHAAGDVSLFSKELLIPHSENLRLQFTEKNEVQAEHPPTAEKAGASLGRPATLIDNMPGNQPKQPAASEKARTPLEMRAKFIDATIVRIGTKTDVERLQAEGDVRVAQPALQPQEKAIDIRSDRLDLLRFPTGHVMKLFAPEENPASAQIDKLVVIGPYIELDQTQNIVQVSGRGRMRMPSKSDFEGTALKEPTDVILSWTKRMLFDGRSAEFDGQVVALQGPASLACDKLTVVLDRQISMRERTAGPGGKEPTASLHRLLCNKDVVLEKRLHEGTPRYDYQRVRGQQLDFDNQTGFLIVQGPGIVDIVRPGQDLVPAGQQGRNAPSVQKLKLTRIVFQGRMEAQQKTGLVAFTGDKSELFHVPGASPDVHLDADKLPPESIHVTCRILKGISRKLENQQSAQEFEASQQVRVRFGEYVALTDHMKFEEQKGWLVMEGRNGNPVRLSRQLRVGEKPQVMQAGQVIYRLKEGTVEVNNTDSLNVLP